MGARSRLRWPVWAVVVIGLAGAGYAWYKRGKPAIDPAREYRTAVVTRGSVVQAVTANGQISPVKSVQVGSQVSGIIQSIYVDYNSPVTNGQVIAQIDPSTFKQNLTQAEAELSNAEAALELAQLNHRRAKELHSNQLITQADYDKTIVDLHQAEAAKKMREAAVERARVELSRTTITAPVNGIVISRNVDVGQTVAASFNTPTLFLIANDLAKMQIEAMVSEADVGGVEEGQRVEFTVDAFPTRKFEGFVKQVRYAPITNQNVVNYVTVVDVENPDLKLRPGMTANASIITARRDGVLRIPTSAFLFRPKETPGSSARTNVRSMPLAATQARTNNPSTNQIVQSASPDNTAPTPPWVAEGRSPNGFEEVRRWMDSLTPEQREAARARMREQMGRAGGGMGMRRGQGIGMQGGFGSGRTAPARQAEEGPVSRTVYVLEKGPDGKPTGTPRPVQILTGINDGAYTEVIEGLNEDDIVVLGLNTTTSTTTTGMRPGGIFGPAMPPMRGPR